MKRYDSITRNKLRDRSYAIAYLEDGVRRGPGCLYAALREVVQAHEGGFAWLSKFTGLGRASLYKALSEDGNPSYVTIHRVLEALGLDLAVAETYKTMKPTILNNNNLIMDKGGVEYKTSAQVEAAPAKMRILPGSAKGVKYSMADDFNAPLSISDEAEQEQFRVLTEELYAEADAIERHPRVFANPEKTRIADMVTEKHRRIGLKL